MAEYIYKSMGDYFDFCIRYDVTTQSIENNKSTVKIDWGMRKKGATSQTYNLNTQLKAEIGGTSYFDGVVAWDMRSMAVGSYQWFNSETITVTHDSYGDKSLWLYGYINVGSLTNTNPDAVTISGNYALPTIPRKATVTAAPNFNDEANPTITYSNSAGSAVTSLKACISLDGSADDIAYRDISKTGTSYTFNLTEAERNVLRAATTGSNSRSVRFYVQTILGGVTYLSYLEKTLTIVNGTPTLSPTIADIDADMLLLTGDSSKFVRYYSNPSYAVNAVAKKGARISSYKVTCGKVTRTTATGEFYDIDTSKVTFSVTDNRGNTASKVVNLNMINYVKLSCNLDATAPTATGDMAFTISGNCFNGSFGAVNNALTVQYRHKVADGAWGEWTAAAATLSGNTYTAAVNLSGLDYQSAHTLQARAWDSITIVESVEKTVKTTPVFDWGSDDFNVNAPIKINRKTVLRINGNNNNTILSADDAQNGIFLRPNGTGDAAGQAILDTSGNLTLTGGLTANGLEFGANKILWNGTLYMTGSQTIALSEKVSEQAHGIVLLFSPHTGGVGENANFSAHFIPKIYVSLFEGSGVNLSMFTVNFNVCATKYLYINDATIRGNDYNTATGTTNGITYANTRYVLRYVIGV